MKKLRKKLKFEDINDSSFERLDVEKMKRVTGGYTSNTVTVYSDGGGQDDGPDDIGYED